MPSPVSGSTPIVISPDQLAAQLENGSAGVVVVDCRFSLLEPNVGREQYAAGHIPGAFYLDLNQDLSAPVGAHGGRHPLPEVESFAAKIRDMGVTAETLVVAYDDARFAFAARLWWLLRWLGHERVAVLNGGLTAYRTAGYPLTTAMPTAQAGNWQPRPQAGWWVDIHEVKACKDLPGVVLIDSREPERYRGEREPIDPVAGHIPGAVNYPWQQITDDNGQLQPLTALQAHWATLPNSQEIMVYCGSGVTACVNVLGLAAAGYALGADGAKLYAGSWSDWCSYLVLTGLPRLS
jgi:thiosulfate/3-mercaptopyruvate sulfurtransferase